MLKRRIRIAQFAQGDEARKKFQIGIVLAIGQLVAGRNFVGITGLTCAHQIACQSDASVCPSGGVAEMGCGIAAVQDQRRGIGTTSLAIAQSAEPLLHLWAFQCNLPARRFYEWHGFQIERETDGANNDERQPDILYCWSRTSFPTRTSPV